LLPTGHGPLKLYHFIIIVAVVLAFLSQLPSLHSLRHINFVSLLLSLAAPFLWLLLAFVQVINTA
jgi:hypothetical protein